MLQPATLLGGKRGLVVGIANELSIAAGCARAFREAGAELAVTYLNEKARPHVEPVASAIGARIVMPFDVEVQGSLEAIFDRIRHEWGGSIFCCIRSPIARRTICTAGSSIVPVAGSRKP